jgi:hypothetical protein
VIYTTTVLQQCYDFTFTFTFAREMKMSFATTDEMLFVLVRSDELGCHTKDAIQKEIVSRTVVEYEKAISSLIRLDKLVGVASLPLLHQSSVADGRLAEQLKKMAYRFDSK